jgi:hypothetical protein
MSAFHNLQQAGAALEAQIQHVYDLASVAEDTGAGKRNDGTCKEPRRGC